MKKSNMKQMQDIWKQIFKFKLMINQIDLPK